LHTLLNVFKYQPKDQTSQLICSEGREQLDEISELSYLTQIVIRLFEDKKDATKYYCELLLSPGATSDCSSNEKSFTAPYITLCKHVSCDELIECIQGAIDESSLEDVTKFGKYFADLK
jgi:hypothetical protein